MCAIFFLKEPCFCFCFALFACLFVTGSGYVAQAGLQLTILLPEPPKCKRAPPHAGQKEAFETSSPERSCLSDVYFCIMIPSLHPTRLRIEPRILHMLGKCATLLRYTSSPDPISSSTILIFL
jgi:hypothetical protein